MAEKDKTSTDNLKGLKAYVTDINSALREHLGLKKNERIPMQYPMLVMKTAMDMRMLDRIAYEIEREPWLVDPDLIGVSGQPKNAQTPLLATYEKNLYYGCDMENDNEDIKVWFSDDDQVYKILAKWNSGVQIAFLDQVVLGTFAATPATTLGIAGGVAALAPLGGAYDSTNKYIETHPNT